MAILKLNLAGNIIEMESEDVSKAIETGELTIATDDLTIYKNDDFETFKTNYGGDEYKKGKVAGVEMLIKEAKERNGLDFEGKTFEKYDEALKAKVISEANIKPTEQITELERQKKALQDNYTSLEGEFTTFKTNVTEKETRTKKDNTILSLIPDNIIVDKDIALLTLKAKAGLDVDDNGIALINGLTTRDKLEQDIPLSKDIITEKLTLLNLMKKTTGGKGGGDEIGGGSAGSYEKFVIEMENNNTKPGSEKFSEEMNKRIKDGTLKM